MILYKDVSFKLSRLTNKDGYEVVELRNQRESVQQSLSKQTVSLSWWQEVVSNPKIVALGFFSEAKLLGVCILDFQDGTVTWSFFVDQDSPLDRLGSVMLSMVLFFLRNYTDVEKVSGHVLISNEKSLSLHERLGFRISQRFPEHLELSRRL